MPSFEVHGPLPGGTALLEASAGTGKTFTIAALTARYVAEDDLPIDRLLVMTFTRMATGELRERVRDRLVRAFDGLADVLAGRQPPQGDDIVRLLADVPRAEQERRCTRLGKAIADFDAATIETTHGFCLQVLYGLGTAGDVDRDVTLVEDVRDLTGEVVDDLYLRKFAHREKHDCLLAGGGGQGRPQGPRHPRRLCGAAVVRRGRTRTDAAAFRRARAQGDGGA